VHVQQLWCHPVKSFQGEQVEEVAVESSGIQGDRRWGVRDATTGRVLTGRREPRLLHASARLVGDEPELVLPNGTVCRGTGGTTDEALSRWLDTPVSLVAAAAEASLQAEYFADATDDSSTAIEWTMPPGRFVDAAPLLMLTTSSLRSGASLHPAGDWDVRRFRPNVVIGNDGEGWEEDGWCGRSVRIGDVALVPQERCVRCTMVTRPQPALERDLDTYRTIARHHAGTLGVWTAVRTPGVIRVGDPLVVG
jgi:uncharacterized protein YcbX